MNLGTGTVALPGGVPNEFSYRVTSEVAPEVSEAQLEAATITLVDRSEELKLLPPPGREPRRRPHPGPGVTVAA